MVALMGSPVSPVVANICMEEIEDLAINATPFPPRYWKHYVDDSFCIIKKNAVVSLFYDSLNSIDPLWSPGTKLCYHVTLHCER